MTRRLVEYCSRLLLILALGLAMAGCSDSFDRSPEGPKQPVTIGFGIGASGDKTTIDADGVSTSWQESDKVYLWARNPEGDYVLNRKEFSMHGYYKGEAVFLTSLAEPMAEGEYLYYACYPKPLSVSETTATFEIPSQQDGKVSGGADIMIAEPVMHRELTPYIIGEHSELNLNIRHQLHVLRFFLPEGSDGLNGEPIRKIKVEFSKNVTGKITLDISDPYATADLSEGNNILTVIPEQPLQPSTADGRNYACAAICPTSFADGGTMKITLISGKWIGTAREINLSGREFAAGHCTAVRMNVADIEPLYILSFPLKTNNLGENVQKVDIELSDTSCHLGDEGSYSYVWEPGGDITVGSRLEFSYTDISKFLALSGKRVTITYDSKHVRCGEEFTIPNLSSLRSYDCNLTVPWLLYEDFSTLSTFSSNDEHVTSSTGSKDAVGFLNGWSGGRVGGQAGKCVRIAGRRECGMWIDAHYPARMDSAPLPQIKSPVNIEVSFDYGTNRAYQVSSAVKGQTVYVGYVTSTQKYASGDETGTYEGGENNISTDALDGSWTSTPNRAVMVLHNVPAGTQNRISWRDDPWGKSEFGANTTTWCYIDNVKVKVKNN